MSLAVIFPGQGSQAVGMGSGAAAASDRAAGIWDEIDGILDRPLTEIIANGPKDLLDDTGNAQPALFSVNYMYWEALKAKGLVPAYFLGHSLGEISACAAAGVFPFAVGLKIVERRAALMARAAAAGPGGMLAVLGLDGAKTAAVAESTGLEVANYNSPGQVVVAGPNDRLEAAEAAFKLAGAKRVVRLAVSGAFHTSIMAEAADRFAEFLAPIEFADPKTPVVANVSGTAVVEAGQIKESLVEQIKSPVRWTDCIEFLLGSGVNQFIEAGPGKVLGGLVKRISPGAEVGHADEYVG